MLPTTTSGPHSFQSHAGSIEAHKKATAKPLHTLGFNPTLVRLRPRDTKRTEPGQSCFNPTLVRLRRPIQRPLRYRDEGFQSHAGSIEAPEFAINRLTAHVSIPRWFD